MSQALAPACKCPRTFDQIIQWLRRDALINQRALVLIVQTSLRNPPMMGLKQLTYSIEVFANHSKEQAAHDLATIMEHHESIL